ncbi:apolipoprotein acyltransferase [Donghicola mangrovi]|uniref:Apolipoprotein acyltransferase n=1 Tax=Donghicola mangrovi TaxID=2729614 RepID=A0A850Q410_9RHOB|nr:apolipoprotein acyltransferase [Donghicola mangrovi]NVO23694.1 apolipoprotein acyltransferase [Donghicola mangrovi]
MLFVIGFMIFGGAIGGLLASRRKGATSDIIHYIATYAVIFAILGLLVQVILLRNMG